MLTALNFSFFATSLLENRNYICHFQERMKLKNRYFITVKNGNALGKEVNISF